MRDAMLKVASGDLTVDTGYTARRDEIGALAGALETFKQQAMDKLRIEEQERERNTGATTRQQAIRSLRRRIREHGAANAAGTGRRFRSNEKHVGGLVVRLPPDQ